MHLVFLTALRLVYLLMVRGQKMPLLKVLERIAPRLSLWAAVMVTGLLVVMAAQHLAVRQVVVMILRQSMSLLLPSFRPLRSLQSFSSLQEAYSMTLGRFECLIIRQMSAVDGVKWWA